MPTYIEDIFENGGDKKRRHQSKKHGGLTLKNKPSAFALTACLWSKPTTRRMFSDDANSR